MLCNFISISIYRLQMTLLVCISFSLKCWILLKMLVHVDIQGTPLPPGWTSRDFLLNPAPPLLVHVVVECPHVRNKDYLLDFSYTVKGYLSKLKTFLIPKNLF